MITQIETALKNKLSFISVNNVRVRVFDHTLEGQQYSSAYPSISWNALEPRFDENRFIYKDDIFKFKDGDPYDPDHLPTKALFRPHPLPWDLNYQIQLWALDRKHLNQMEEQLMISFHPRGNLKVLDDNGKTVYLQTIFQSVTSLDSLDLRAEGSRELRKAYTYTVQAWLEISPSKESPLITEDPELGLREIDE